MYNCLLHNSRILQPALLLFNRPRSPLPPVLPPTRLPDSSTFPVDVSIRRSLEIGAASMSSWSGNKNDRCVEDEGWDSDLRATEGQTQWRSAPVVPEKSQQRHCVYPSSRDGNKGLSINLQFPYRTFPLPQRFCGGRAKPPAYSIRHANST